MTSTFSNFARSQSQQRHIGAEKPQRTSKWILVLRISPLPASCIQALQRLLSVASHSLRRLLAWRFDMGTTCRFAGQGAAVVGASCNVWYVQALHCMAMYCTCVWSYRSCIYWYNEICCFRYYAVLSTNRIVSPMWLPCSLFLGLAVTVVESAHRDRCNVDEQDGEQTEHGVTLHLAPPHGPPKRAA